MVGRNSTLRNIISKIGDLTLVKSLACDIPPIAENIREDDAYECSLFSMSPYEALLEGFTEEDSRSYTLLNKGIPIGMMGVVRENDDIGRVWFLATDDVYKEYRKFLRKCPEVIDVLQGDFRVIFNYVPEENKKTMRWLIWCGFLFDINNKYLHGSSRFMKFFRCKEEKSVKHIVMSQPIYH